MSTKNSQKIQCPACSHQNLIKYKHLLELSSALSCDACSAPLLKHFEEPFLQLEASAFVHTLDYQMLNAMKKIPGVDTLLRTLLRHSFELSMRLHHQGNYVQISKKQFKSLNALAERACTQLDLGFMPEIFVVPEARANAYTFGVEKCAVAISSGCLEIMTKEEILAVIAHEFGHIKANHVLYKTATRILSTMAESIAQRTLGLGGLMLYPIKVALLRWDRASELSSDRAALLVVKNPSILLNTLMKLASGSANMKELDIDAFVKQAESYEKTQDEGPLGKYIAVMNSMFNTHPFPIWRAREIIDWVKSGDYIKILQGDYNKKRLSTSCPLCGAQIQGQETICRGCEEPKKHDQKDGDALDQTIKNFQSWLKKSMKTD